jgi:hypothetical protein
MKSFYTDFHEGGRDVGGKEVAPHSTFIIQHSTLFQTCDLQSTNPNCPFHPIFAAKSKTLCQQSDIV